MTCRRPNVGLGLCRRLFSVVSVLILVGFAAVAQAENVKEVVVRYNGRPQRVTYEYYVPPYQKGDRLGVLICTGGLPMEGDTYLRSDTRECFGEAWTKFADRERLLILGLGFQFIPEDWPKQESYQFAGAWSGEALNDIIDILKNQFPVDIHELCLFGISAGAQFSIRFAQMRPESVIAVTAHAAGGFDEPREYIPTKFLLTVGSKDNAEIKRLDMAREFARMCVKRGIDVRLKVIGGIGHRQTEPQNVLSRVFLAKVLRERRSHP